MALIRPFRAGRPQPEYAAQVAALPYDVYTAADARVAAEGNPYSFLHVDKAEIDLPDDISPYDARVYAKAKENLDKLYADGILIQETHPCLYVYRLTAGGCAQTGLACCVSVDEYERGIILKHELTRQDKEQDRINHVNACEAHTGPIFLAYRKTEATAAPQALMEVWTANHAPVYDFDGGDGVRHTVWQVDDAAAITALTTAFAGVPVLYIADGHHRNASAMQVARQRLAASGEAAYPRDAEYAFYLSVIFPHDELTVLDYNRVVKDLNGLDQPGFLRALAADFELTASDGPVKPDRKGQFGLYVAGRWYRLVYKPAPDTDVVEALDVSVLQRRVLTPVLGIGDPRTDKRIDFVGGIRGTAALVRRVDCGEMAVAFTLYPTTIADLMAVADAGRIMPPKSTWFEPKLRSGLLIHHF